LSGIVQPIATRFGEHHAGNGGRRSAARRVTLAGSTMPAASMSTYCSPGGGVVTSLKGMPLTGSATDGAVDAGGYWAIRINGALRAEATMWQPIQLFTERWQPPLFQGPEPGEQGWVPPPGKRCPPSTAASVGVVASSRRRLLCPSSRFSVRAHLHHGPHHRKSLPGVLGAFFFVVGGSSVFRRFCLRICSTRGLTATCCQWHDGGWLSLLMVNAAAVPASPAWCFSSLRTGQSR